MAAREVQVSGLLVGLLRWVQGENSGIGQSSGLGHAQPALGYKQVHGPGPQGPLAKGAASLGARAQFYQKMLMPSVTTPI